MAGNSPGEALEAFIERLRSAIQCVADTEVFGNTASVGAEGRVLLVPRDGEATTRVPIRTSEGHRDLQLGILHEYTIVKVDKEDNPDVPRGPFKVSSSRYMYDLLDRDGNEILIFHWHPVGTSPEVLPHMHVAGARPVELALRPNGDVPKRLDISHVHIPTPRMFIEDVIHLLIRDLRVQSRRNDWADVLTENLRAVELGRTW